MRISRDGSGEEIHSRMFYSCVLTAAYTIVSPNKLRILVGKDQDLALWWAHSRYINFEGGK